MKQWIFSVIFAFNLPLAHAHFVELNSLKEFTMAAVGDGWSGGNILLGSEAHVFGSVAASRYLGLGAGVKIDGDACSAFIGAGQSEMSNISGKKGDCGQFSSLHDAVTGLSLALTQPHQEREDLKFAKTFGSGVYHVNDIVLQSQDAITFRGIAGQKFVLNIYGHAQFGSGSAIKLEGGVRPEDVFFNFIKSAQYSSFEFGGATLVGTFVSNGRDFIMGDGAILNQTRFYTTGNMIANIQDVRFDNVSMPPIVIPDEQPNIEVVNSPINPAVALILFVLPALLYRKRVKKNSQII